MRCVRPSLIATYIVMISVAASSLPALADPSGFHYGGRIVSKDGKPAPGPVDLEIRFFDDDTAGVPALWHKKSKRSFLTQCMNVRTATWS